MQTILERIVDTKRQEVEAAKRLRPREALEAQIGRVDPPRDFYGAVLSKSDDVALIAEIKKASPSAGLIVSNFDPVSLARTYHRHGAAALSVLTDPTYFQGELDFIQAVRQAAALPVLRKDFMIDEYQVYESRAAGADAILLIVEAIGVAGVASMLPVANQLDLTVLVEVHSGELLSALFKVVGQPGSGRYLLGINNRDLSRQRTDLSTMAQLGACLPWGTPFVAESGLQTRADVCAAQAAGARAILVGESLLRAKNIGVKIDELIGR